MPLGILSSNEYRRLRVRESYGRILDRQPGASALGYWSTVVARVSYNRLDQLLIGSGEFRAKHPTDAVAAVFLAALRRAPSAGETATWTARLASGTSLAAMAATLQTSTEGYDVVINDRYQRSLGHGPGQFDRFVWLAELRAGTSPERMWARLLVGGEFLNKYPPTQDDFGGPGFGAPVPVFDFSGR